MDVVTFAAAFAALLAAGFSNVVAASLGAAVGVVLGRDRRVGHFPDPFGTPHSEEEFKAIYRFYREDVRRLARALHLPRLLRTPQRDVVAGDVALLVLLYKCVLYVFPSSATLLRL